MSAALALVLALLVLLPQVAGANPPADRVVGPLQDPQRDCSEMVPESYSVTGVTDTGQRISLDVLVLLDGITRSSARETLARAAGAYDPLEIDLTAARFEKLRLEADDEEFGRPTGEVGRVFAEMKRHMGGHRPEGIDVVYLLTNKALFIETGTGRVYGIAGMADCIGGVRWPETSFAIGVGDYGDPEWRVDQAAITLAHEIGHLMGAHHHYANCVEGPPPSMCTVMFNASLEFIGLGFLNSLKFGTAESVVIRGHAVDFVAPSDGRRCRCRK